MKLHVTGAVALRAGAEFVVNKASADCSPKVTTPQQCSIWEERLREQIKTMAVKPRQERHAAARTGRPIWRRRPPEREKLESLRASPQVPHVSSPSPAAADHPVDTKYWVSNRTGRREARLAEVELKLPRRRPEPFVNTPSG